MEILLWAVPILLVVCFFGLLLGFRSRNVPRGSSEVTWWKNDAEAAAPEKSEPSTSDIVESATQKLAEKKKPVAEPRSLLIEGFSPREELPPKLQISEYNRRLLAELRDDLWNQGYLDIPVTAEEWHAFFEAKF